MTHVERLESEIDAVDVFRRLAGLPHVVFFDSSMRGGPLGRYSFVAADPIEWWERHADGAAAFAQVTRVASHLSGEPRPDLPPFQGGVAGMFGYELAGCFEKVPTAGIADFHIPVVAAGWYDVVFAFDHVEQAAWIVSQGWPETEPQARSVRASDRAAQFRAWLRDGARERPLEENVLPPHAIGELAPQHDVGIDGLTSNFSADGYLRAVRRAIEYIHAGDVFQVNLAQRLLHAAEGSAVDLYCRLRERNAAPFAGYLDGGDWQLCSALPERFLRVADGCVETRPIKGTAARRAGVW